MAEIWDVYDENRNKKEKKHKRGIPLQKGDYHIVINVWLINSQNQMLLTQRHPCKSWGYYWECTGGSVLEGETSLDGAVREVGEEIGVLLNPEEGVLINKERREHDFVDTWLFKKDVAIEELTLQAEEVVDAKWVTLAQYLEMRKKGLIVTSIKNFADYHIL